MLAIPRPVLDDSNLAPTPASTSRSRTVNSLSTRSGGGAIRSTRCWPSATRRHGERAKIGNGPADRRSVASSSMERGDIWLMSLDPASGHEQQGRRPVLVVSPGAFNRLTGVPIVLPITTGGSFARTAGLRSHLQAPACARRVWSVVTSRARSTEKREAGDDWRQPPTTLSRKSWRGWPRFSNDAGADCGHGNRRLHQPRPILPEIVRLTLIQPFRALRPAPGRAAEVLAPPYDVLSSAEARERAEGKPWSFLHVSKPEIDLAPDDRSARSGGLRQGGGESRPHGRRGRPHPRRRTVLLRLPADPAGPQRRPALPPSPRSPTTRTNRIRKHELTTPVKEDDRVHQIEAVNAQTGPVMIAYPVGAGDRRHARRRRQGPARGRCHRRRRRPPPALGRSRDKAAIDALTRAVDALPAALHRRRTSPLGSGFARRRGSRQRRRVAALLPLGALPRARDDHPRLQPRAPRPQRPHTGGPARRARRALHGRAVGRAGPPCRRGRIRHVPRRPLVSADAPPDLIPAEATRSAGCRSPC